jgi:hypothetical protein
MALEYEEIHYLKDAGLFDSQSKVGEPVSLLKN